MKDLTQRGRWATVQALVSEPARTWAAVGGTLARGRRGTAFITESIESGSADNVTAILIEASA
jgi:hypothetical protein